MVCSRKVRRRICCALSKFGSSTSNAHGLPSTTVGQPGHCAYSRRRTNGTWELNYSVTGHSQLHLCFWNHHEWQYVAALESTFNTDRETRLAADRQLTLAGPSTVVGIVLDNNFGQNAGRQVPIEVSVSEDEKEWTKVYTNQSVEKTYRVDLRGHAAAARVQYVRVARTKGAGKNFFHLNKILVYGKKLY